MAAAGFEKQQVGVGFEHSFTNPLGRDVRDPHLATELTRPLLGISRDTREKRPVRTRDFDPFTQRPLGRHLDQAEQRALRVFGVEEGRHRLEQRTGPRRIGRRDQNAIVAHVLAESNGSIRSLINRSQESASSTRRRNRAWGDSIASRTARVKAGEPPLIGTRVAPSGATSRKAGRSVQTTGTRKIAASASGSPKPSLALGNRT